MDSLEELLGRREDLMSYAVVRYDENIHHILELNTCEV
jgi:hypothetical protein